MDAIVSERANGPFTSLDDLFRRVPAGSMNRRGLEALAAAGAFDRLEPDRAKVFASAELLLAVAIDAERGRTSGQAALFGGDDHAEPSLRLADVPAWSRADQMAKERENFGFYFSEHPVGEWRHVASANGARSHASLMTGGVSGGGRSPGVMAALVENVQRRKTRKGSDFAIVEFSDQSGQFSASCFEESLVEPFLRWAADGTCVLLNVELDAPSADEPPRVTVRGARPLAEVRANARMVLTLDIETIDAVRELALLLPRAAEATGEVLAKLQLAGGSEQALRLGRDFVLDGELAEQLGGLDGVHNVSLSARRAEHLRLVA
jgi:DNA polymerase-3 subunit alpha